MNKIELVNFKSDTVFNIEVGDILIDVHGEVFLVSLTGGKKEDEIKLISIDTANRWDDDINTLDKIKDWAIKNQCDVYRNNHIKIQLGDLIRN